jgi:hypothetical protein
VSIWLKEERDWLTKIVQKLIRTNIVRYSFWCSGKRKMNIWYGKDCKYPSRGWNAWDANGVGTSRREG